MSERVARGAGSGGGCEKRTGCSSEGPFIWVQWTVAGRRLGLGQKAGIVVCGKPFFSLCPCESLVGPLAVVTHCDSDGRGQAH